MGICQTELCPQTPVRIGIAVLSHHWLYSASEEPKLISQGGKKSSSSQPKFMESLFLSQTNPFKNDL